MWQTIAQLLEEHLGPGEIQERRELPGGEIHSAWFIRYGEHDVFIKSDSRELLTKFRAEAEQLELLAKSKTVQIPAVYGVGCTRDYSFLLLQYLSTKPLDAHSAWCLGQHLAKLHQWSDQPQFGLDFDNDLSTTPQPNAWQRRWSTFFAEQRIGWQLQLAAEKGLSFGDIGMLIATVEQRLASHQPQPALLHGDLWSGNWVNTSEGCYLFDPACYWGDRECDLAMLPLYPDLPKQIYDGYQSVWPLDKGFVERQPIYQLYYLLNRANLFGGKHVVAAQQAIESALLE
ncbi:fructosamine kinase family protein [Musicola paradisiaca]|uniref:Fructosamine kinase n=1 Tax=Musicola paradisiaca (strain Ech703) TaxID=579405 RepID=C6C627_MUSP7|nr:fructosamine kinase family protein [Musicola paradisiaca]ACS85818.1 fructosamine kinase [Musicola paradisiaca Ech703]